MSPFTRIVRRKSIATRSTSVQVQRFVRRPAIPSTGRPMARAGNAASTAGTFLVLVVMAAALAPAPAYICGP